MGVEKELIVRVDKGIWSDCRQIRVRLYGTPNFDVAYVKYMMSEAIKNYFTVMTDEEVLGMVNEGLPK